VPDGPQKLLTAAAPALVASVLRQFGRARLRAIGGSMFPSIESGDTLTIHRCTLDEIRHDDVVLMIDGDRLYAHRLVATPIVDGERRIVTRGDAHWRDDPPRPASSLLGRVDEVMRQDRALGRPPGVSTLDRVRGLAASEWTRVRAQARRLVARRA
jgi:hypothetical protein